MTRSTRTSSHKGYKLEKMLMDCFPLSLADPSSRIGIGMRHGDAVHPKLVTDLQRDSLAERKLGNDSVVAGRRLQHEQMPSNSEKGVVLPMRGCGLACPADPMPNAGIHHTCASLFGTSGLRYCVRSNVEA
eukprot:TRINITY_DN45401_c0_g1_i2.p1 TRINITY_DN45401_c0_g1~~TRINITY_DN45401_c0_g1_i2.p1  ORF type:complete len:131 (+),score=11.43 TRINITY_DN45401_c0_g1_i2:364-756(+)